MEPKKKLPLSLNGSIPRNLFPKTLSFKENRKYPSKEKNKNIEPPKQGHKPIKSFIYLKKFPKSENKKEQNIIQKSKLLIDSKTEARLPQEYIDLSYDNPINE